MEEARKFLRYTLPGLIYVILSFISYWLINSEGATDFLKSVQDWQIAIGLFIVSGGLGFAFSVIYFGALWASCGKDDFYFRHKNILQQLDEAGKSTIKDTGDRTLKVKDLTERDSWYILNTYWHANKNTSPEIKGVAEKIDNYYSDLTHSLGSVIVAGICSLITTVLIYLFYTDCFCNINFTQFFAFLLNTIFLWLSYENWSNTRKSYHELVNNTFLQDIMKENETAKTIYFFDSNKK